MSSRAGLDVSEKRILAPAGIRTADRPASKFVAITTTLSRILYPEDGSNIFLRNLRIYVQVGYRCFGTTCRFTSSRVKTSITKTNVHCRGTLISRYIYSFAYFVAG